MGRPSDVQPLVDLVMYLIEVDKKRKADGLSSLFDPPSPPITDPSRILQYFPNGKLWVYKPRRPYTRRQKPTEEHYMLGLS